MKILLGLIAVVILITFVASVVSDDDYYTIELDDEQADKVRKELESEQKKNRK